MLGRLMGAAPLDKAPLAQVLSTLGVQSDHGLSADEAKARLAKYGPNGIAAHEESFARKVVRCFVARSPS